jgi:hypothetical protein
MWQFSCQWRNGSRVGRLFLINRKLLQASELSFVELRGARQVSLFEGETEKTRASLL